MSITLRVDITTVCKISYHLFIIRNTKIKKLFGNLAISNNNIEKFICL